jgi:hypothetical protein
MPRLPKSALSHLALAFAIAAIASNIPAPATACPNPDQASYVTKLVDGIAPHGIHLDRMVSVNVDVRLDDRGRVLALGRAWPSRGPAADGRRRSPRRRSNQSRTGFGCSQAWSHHASASLNGSDRSRLPFSLKMALAIAGAIGGTKTSPIPDGGAVLATMWTSIGGASAMCRTV